MRLSPLPLLCLAVSLPQARAAARDPAGGGAPDRCASSPIAGARQVLLSVTPSWGSTQTTIRGFFQGEKGWAPEGASFAGVVGRSGLAWGIGLHANPDGADLKREGDGRAPAGVFSLAGMFGYDSERDQHFGQPTPLPYLQATASSRCVDDGASTRYNHVVPDATAVTQDWASAEDIRRNDELYRYGIVVDHNRVNLPPGTPGRDPRGGSCIFLHVWGGADSRTSGCTAMPADQIRRLQHWLRRDDAPVLVQLPLEEYLRRREEWCLPEMHVAAWVPPLAEESRARAEGGVRAPRLSCPVL